MTDKASGASAFGSGAFTAFWVSALVSNSGAWLAQLTVPYLLYRHTNSALWVAAVAVASFVPVVIFSVWGGTLADRFRRHTIVLLTQAGMALAVTVLWLQSLLAASSPQWMLAPIAVLGCLQGLGLPAWTALVNDLVPRHQLRSAVSLNSPDPMAY